VQNYLEADMVKLSSAIFSWDILVVNT
jgi:hypothetical protein